MLYIYYSKTVSACTDHIFNTISKTRGNCKQVIFTPDRMTLQLEEKLFDALNEKCVFDVDVTTLTRFTNKIVSENNIKHRVLTKPVCVALIKKILNENKDDFKTIKKALNFNGFATTIFNTISMFKSCNVTPEKLELSTKNKNLNYKLEDLKLIYSKYEQFLQGDYTDSFNKLNLLIKLIKSLDLTNYHFYFVGFNDFTPQMYSVVKELAKKSASVSVACAVNYVDELNNKNIYLNNVYLNLIDMCHANGVLFKTVYAKANYKNEFNVISNNLFGLNLKKSSTQAKNLELYKFNTKIDEINFAIKKIHSLIVNNGLTYNDVVIVTPSLAEYKQIMESAFLENNLPYFFDESEPISSSIVLRFYFDLFELKNNNYHKRDVFNFLRSYSDLSCEQLNTFEDIVNKSGYNYKSVLKPIPHMQNVDINCVYEKLKVLLNFDEKLSKINRINEYCELLCEVANLFGFNVYLNELLKVYKQKNNILEHNKLNNVVTKVNKGFVEIGEVLANYQTSYSDAFNIIKAYFENITVVMPPILADSVLVVDILKSELPNKKVAIIMGMEEGKMPIVQTDLGLISDQDINLLNSNFKLSPTINIINKRNRFKIFETMLQFNQLICGYVSTNSKGEEIMPSEIINNLTYLFPDLKVVNGTLIQNNYQNQFTNNYFEFNNSNKNFSKVNLINNLKLMQTDNSVVLKQNSANLIETLNKTNSGCLQLVENLNYKNQVENINIYNTNLSLDSVSVSEIESYYSCPFKHFVDYCLKLNKVEDAKFSALEYGNILHEYVKIVVPKIKKFTFDELNSFGQTVIDEILNKDNYKHLKLNPNNLNEIKSLKREIVRINGALFKLSNSESLTPYNTWLEKSFNNFEVSNKNLKVKLKGVIDRVDVDDESFAVIDYKTGESDFSDFTDIVSGKKLQLIIYAYIVSVKTNKQVVGTFYLPLKNSYSKTNPEELYKLKGVISNNLSDVLKLDKNLNQAKYSSSVLNLKTKKDGGLTGKILIERSDFDKLINYSLNMVLSAVEQIKNGNIAPNPLKQSNKTTCDYCKYLGMCKFNLNHGNSFREVENIKSVNELEI